MDTADEAALIRLLTLVSARLPGLAIRPNHGSFGRMILINVDWICCS
jgi:hypothetical protein